MDSHREGLLLFLCGTGLAAYSWYLVIKDAEFEFLYGLLGPPVAVLGFAQFVLPERKLTETSELTQGQMTTVHHGQSGYTRLGCKISIVGAMLGVANLVAQIAYYQHRR